MRNNDLAQAFARGASDGHGSNMFIECDSIYSYGHHFVLAKRIGLNEYLWNPDGYSSSTGTHKGIVSGALYGRTLWDAPDCDTGKIAGYYLNEIEDLEVKILKARSALPRYVQEFKCVIEAWKRSKERFKLKCRELEKHFKFLSDDRIAMKMIIYKLSK